MALRNFEIGVSLEATSNQIPMTGDRPIVAAADDRLGFQPLAKRLARALVDQASTDGMVVGLEGRWGSGKSSLLNLTRIALEALPVAMRPVVVEFKPWLVGDRDALLGAFFAQLATEIEALEVAAGQSGLADKRKQKELANRLRKYASRAEVFGSILSAIPAVGWIGKAIKAAGMAGKSTEPHTPLLTLKTDLDKALAALNRRIVITIDDVDRLDPREVTELLRLVRSVADFKNVIYVLCYDGEILAHGIERAVGVADGHAYLEKIVQVSIAVPIPEPFHLRRWFEQELQGLAVAADEGDRQRVRNVIDSEGGRRLDTPRHVVRVLNALRMILPALRDEVDLADLVWLQLIKASNHKLYRWIESYCAEAAAASHWKVRISDGAVASAFKALEGLLEAEGRTFDNSRDGLSNHLPGINIFSLKNDEQQLYCRVSEHEARLHGLQKRLSSPDHYRLYFALAQPSSAPKAQDFDDLLSAADKDAPAVSRLIEGWAKEVDPALGSKAEIILDRVRERGPEAITHNQAERMLLALADSLDHVGGGQLDDFGQPTLWREADRALPVLLKALDVQWRENMVKSMFGQGRALAWLTSILRRETFAHGRFGERRESESEWLLTESELDEAARLLIDRYRGLSVAEIFELKRPISLLFAWAQAGDPDEVRDKVMGAAATDEGLINVLESLVTDVRSTGGDYRVLKRENVAQFLDTEAALSRLGSLADDRSGPFYSRATVLRDQLERARSF